MDGLFVRMADLLYLHVSFILLFSNTGSKAEDTVYVETGASVQLNIHRDQLYAEFEEIIWQNDKSDTVVKYYNKIKVNHYKPYKNRVDFNNETFSLTLKNMQKTDIGVYTAKITGKINIDIAVHTVFVIDAVATPVLSIISYWSNSDRCTVNFTCTGHDLTLISTYNNGRCSPEEVTSQEKYTLSLICSENNIICNHSNPVSWKKVETDLKQFCEDTGDVRRYLDHYCLP